MLIRVTPTANLTTPTNWATRLVDGGLLYHRNHLRHTQLIAPGVYKRSVPERPYRRVPIFKRRAPSQRARRTLKLGRPPPLTTESQTWRQLVWSTNFFPAKLVKVVHRRHTRFTRWASTAHRGRHYRGIRWGYRPRRQNDPIIWAWRWLHRPGPSLLLGHHPGPLTRQEIVLARLSGLFRRRRHHTGIALVGERTKWYLRGYYHKKRRRLSLAEKRYHLFRRRRLRGGYRRGTTHVAYLRGTTRAGFTRQVKNRAARLETAHLLGTSAISYYQASAQWNTHTWGGRVGTPWEYNYYQPYKGYHRFTKKRRPDARRWKLGQHPWWSIVFQEGRQLRWTWFTSTRVANLQVSTTMVVPPVIPDLTSRLYWSTQRWGRGRWARPDGRAAAVFVSAMKSGHVVEVDASQWGSAAAGPAGVLHSHSLENELTPLYLPPQVNVVLGQTVRPRRSWSRAGLHLRRWIVAVCWRCLVSPVWWIYYWAGLLWCTLWWVTTLVVSQCRTAGVVLGTGFYTLGVQLTRPTEQWVTHWVKERIFIKTASWVWTSWLLAYTTDNEQDELEISTYDDLNNDISMDQEFDLAEEHGQDYDAVDNAIYNRSPLTNKIEPRWHKDVDSFVDDWVESLVDWWTEEVPHQLGLFFRPLADLVIRLPWWGVAEGFSLATLWFKLEWQRQWYALLTKGNTPTRVVGRWWKWPLVLMALLIRVLTTGMVIWLIFSQVDYSAFRLGLTYSWGIPWREEYYAAWFLLASAAGIHLVGPTSWKNYLFQEIGWDTWVGTYIGAAVWSEEEAYYFTRPAGWVEKTITKYTPFEQKHHLLDSFDAERGGWWDIPTVAGYDDTRLRLAQHYGYLSYGYDADGDLEETWFVFPFHQPAHQRPQWYIQDQENSVSNRAARDPFARRHNYYQAETQLIPEHRSRQPHRPHPDLRQRRISTPVDESV